MGFPKAQHYLPQFYLRRFARLSASGRRHQVFVRDLEKNRTFRTSIGNIGQETAFYDIDLGRGGKASLEPAFQKLEQEFAPALEHLLKSRDPDALSIEERAAIALFCGTTHMRGPATRETIVEMVQGINRTLEDTPGRALTEDEVDRVGLNPLTDDQLTYLSGNMALKGGAEIAAILATMRWVLGAAPPGRSIPTSDCPVVLHNEVSAPEPMGNLGFLCRGIEVHFPLSAEFTLQCFHGEDFPELADIKVIQLVEDNLLFLTDILVTRATRFLLSRDGDFELRPSMKRLGRRVEIR